MDHYIQFNRNKNELKKKTYTIDPLLKKQNLHFDLFLSKQRFMQTTQNTIVAKKKKTTSLFLTCKLLGLGKIFVNLIQLKSKNLGISVIL